MNKTLRKPEDWLTVLELRDFVKKSGRHWSRTYVQYLIRENKLKSFKLGSTRLFSKGDVSSYIKKLKRKAPPVLVKKTLDR